ncbi:Rossmann-like and DUF2520 domain-containing protein [Mesonia aquimarina]|uniref:Rossmann-like and DUF2520 domain-containing protein n=1 Tax=Mesonia aquimarina TaxID=1504967 RepID=UPI000EF5D6F8|nr:DUF2520 domain-containing protein [Mesonia aquimarina]
MIKVVLLGAGNVATHLFNAFDEAKNISIEQVFSRKESSLTSFEKKTAVTTSLENLKEADVYILAVKDDAVKNVIEKIQYKNGLIVHTSGSVPLLKSAKNNGVFYPLQTFSKNTAVDFSKIPLCIEADIDENLALLHQLANSISNSVYEISSEQRKSLHLSAVFVCNFVNHLYSIGEDLCQENKVPFEILHPLILETARKASVNSPASVQTGPAVRNDQKTIDFHLAQLNKADYSKIYTLLTDSIQQKNG